MTKTEWEMKNHYRKSEHNCLWCKHCEKKIIDMLVEKYYCTKKRGAGAGEITKASYDCDLWEHRRS